MSEKGNLIVSVGRQYGSGGLEIAIKLAELLGVEYYDRELLKKSAKSSGLSQEFFESQDERSPLSIAGIFTSGMLSTPDLVGGFSDERLFNIISEQMQQIGQKHSMVVVGRCSDYIFRDSARLVSIFVHAPLKERVKRVALRESLSEREALSKIKRKDKERASYYNFYSDKRWGDSGSYDISINSSLLSIEQTAEMVKEIILKVDGARCQE